MPRVRLSHLPVLVALALLALVLLTRTDAALADPDGARMRRPPPPPTSRYRVELTDGGSRALPVFAHAGRRYVLGNRGARYGIRLSNPTDSRVEAVVSVDGLDAIDGKTAGFGKRGYVLGPGADMVIEGFRTSMDAVATFRFAAVADSYAARKGDDRNVGVIGVAFFRERPREPEIAASAAPPAPAAKGRGSSAKADQGRPGLGTEFGEERTSTVRNTTFERESSKPERVMELRYDDRPGLVALGIPVDGDVDTARRESAEAFPNSRFATPP